MIISKTSRDGKRRELLGRNVSLVILLSALMAAYNIFPLDNAPTFNSILPIDLSTHTVLSDNAPTEQRRASATKSPQFRKVSTCHQNPYRNSMVDDFETMVAQRAEKWLDNMNLHHQHIEANPTIWGHNYERFWVFEPMISNCTDVSCVGGECKQDTSKFVCGLTQLQDQTKEEEEEDGKPPCVVYSIGGNDHWEFEEDILEKTSCEVHTFDCTGPIQRFIKKPQHPRLHFHHVCLGTETKLWPEGKDCEQTSMGNKRRNYGICGDFWTLPEMQERLNHTKIDLLKMDIEGFEWPILESWPELEEEAKSDKLMLPMQILIEVHYESQFRELVPTNFDEKWRKSRRPKEFKSPFHLLEFQSHLLKMGYAVVLRDDNQYCKHCTELTLTRFKCPS